MKTPTTKEELFEMIDREFANGTLPRNPVEAHFGLGLWIRNAWLYDDCVAIYRLFHELEDDMMPMCNPDMLSGEIVEEYSVYRNREGKRKHYLHVQNNVHIFAKIEKEHDISYSDKFPVQYQALHGPRH